MAVQIAKGLASTLTLNDGVVMPMFGFGTYKLGDFAASVKLTKEAIRIGYRLLDTAQVYNNEEAVGAAVRECGLPREDLFVVTKVGTSNMGRQLCEKSVKESLQKLDIGYVDLFLIHTPTVDGTIVETYNTLQDFKKQGLIRSVGVSSFNTHHIEGLKAAGCPLPSINQIELHTMFHQQDIVDYCCKNGIAVMGFSPLAKARLSFENPLLTQVAQRCGKSVPQVMIRWSVQKGYVTIPKSTQTNRIEENANVFDFALTDEEMKSVDGIKEQGSTIRTPQMQPWKG